MIINTSKKINIKNIIITVFFLIIIVMNSGSAIILSNDNAPLIFLFLIGIYFVVIEGLIKRKIFTKIFIKNPLFILSVAIFLNLIIHFDFNSYGGYLRQMLVFIVSILFTLTIDFKSFSKCFVKFIVFVTIFSIIIWLLINVLNIIPPHLILHSNGENVYYNSYYNFLFSFVNEHSPYRIMGPFWEPGVFASMILFALIFNENMDYSKNKKNKIFFILTIGLFLTMSTAGYILFLFFLIYKITKNADNKSSNIFSILVLIFAILIYIFKDDILYKLSLLFPEVFNKLLIDSMSKGTRINSPILDLKIFFQNPLFGVGMSSYQTIWPIYARELLVESRTSTITYFLANYGMIGILYFYTIVKAFINKKNIKFVTKLVLMIMYICIVMKEPHYANLTTTIILSYYYYGLERKK